MTSKVDSELLKLILSKSSSLLEAESFISRHLSSEAARLATEQPKLALDTFHEPPRHPKFIRVKAPKMNTHWNIDELARLARLISDLNVDSSQEVVGQLAAALGRSPQAIYSMWSDVGLVISGRAEKMNAGRRSLIKKAMELPEWPKTPLKLLGARKRKET